tara:strand:+ start:2015 stop:7387 length:5373 start_codon:yes stop_codon:yes gene_type:complete
MSQEAEEECHRTPAEELTLRLGERFAKLCEWACENDLHEELEIIYLLLGLTPNIVGVANLVEEFDHPESHEILKDWAGNPHSDRIKLFVSAFQGSIVIKNNYAAISPAGTIEKVRSQYPDFEKRTFFLPLYTFPLTSSKDPEIFKERRRLRMWLAVQAVSRIVASNNIADRAISRVARFIALGHDSQRWRFVDQLLATAKRFRAGIPESFDRFTQSLRLAADQIGPDYHGDKALSPVLNAITAIAVGESDPYPGDSEHRGIVYSFTNAATVKPIPVVSEHGDCELLIVSDSEEEQLEFTWVVQTDPTDSPEQQQLSSNSFFLQSVETSHYLLWSYDGVLPTEVPALESWISDALQSEEKSTALGASLVWLSCRLGRSLHFVRLFAVSDDLQEEWALSPGFQFLHRRSPQRQNAWQPDESTQSLIQPYSSEIRLRLPEIVTQALLKATSNLAGDVLQLAHLWQNLSDESLEVWFNKICRQYFPRITSLKLAHIAGLNAFQKTGDHNFSRMVASHPNSGLPGACGYATWDIKMLEKGLALPALVNTELANNPNVMGSLLAPLASVIEQEIRHATELLEASRAAGDWLSFHNQFSQYCVVALYAATGCRYLRDPFESLAHFNWDYDVVYINDKTDEGLHSGRLVPLPSSISKLIHAYLNYLDNLATAIQPLRPELSENLRLLVEGGSPAMPLFFQLDNALKWHPMGDSDLPGLPLLTWALPSNVFRHRFAQLLAQAGVSIEVVDGWMGHSERGVSSYSDYSPRCWISDASSYRQELNTIFDALPFEVDALHKLQPTFSQLPELRSSYVEPPKFGQALRKWNRSQSTKQAIRIAKADIALATQVTPIDAMSAEEMDKLVHGMLFRDGTIPHVYAGLRLQVLIKEANRIGGSARHAISRRIATVRPERSLISEQLPSQLAKLKPLKLWAEQISSTINKARLSKRKALIIGATLLCIEKRISYLHMLRDIACGKFYHIIQHGRVYYLEYSETLIPGDFKAPIQRHEISHKVASLLCYGQGIKTRINLESDSCPSELEGLIALLELGQCSQQGLNLAALFSGLAQLVEQTNLVLFPGMVAGALSDRQPPTSLPLQDFLRIRDSVYLELPIEELQAAPNIDFRSLRLNQGRQMENDKVLLQSQAKSLCGGIQHLLNSYSESSHVKTAKTIEKLCNSYEGKTSTAILMLGHWLAHIIKRGYGRKAGSKPYTLNTLETYFSRLNKAFVELAYELDLMAADEAEITRLYNNILNFHRRRGSDPVYVGERLREFSRWAGECGVDDPDWDEIDLESSGRHVRSGALSEHDYQSCLLHLENGLWGSQGDNLFMGFVLFLTYRFGLRRMEAVGLRRKDLCQNDDHTWVLVRNNSHRSLKSPASRRAVPLLFPLSECEEVLLDKVVARYESLVGKDNSKPILCETHGEKYQLTSMADQLPKGLINLMREVTGNMSLVLHHCRHSFYNCIATTLLEIDTPLGKSLSAKLDRESVRRIVLGEHSAITRRSGMALARLVGHSLPGIGLKSYNHIMTDWADALTPVKSARSGAIAGAFNTKSFARYSPPVAPTIIPVTFEQPTLNAIIKTLRLASLGMDYVRAGSLLNLRPYIAESIRCAVDITSNQMRFKLKGEVNRWVSGKDYNGSLLDYISDGSWQRLIEWSQDAGNITLDSEVAYLELDELPYLFSRNRQIMMSEPRHCQCVQEALEALGIEHEQFTILVKDDLPHMIEMANSYGFRPVSSENTEGVQIDPFHIRVGGIWDLRKEYIGLVYKRSNTGVVRNGHELALGVLALLLASYFIQSSALEA